MQLTTLKNNFRIKNLPVTKSTPAPVNFKKTTAQGTYGGMVHRKKIFPGQNETCVNINKLQFISSLSNFDFFHNWLWKFVWEFWCRCIIVFYLTGWPIYRHHLDQLGAILNLGFFCKTIFVILLRDFKRTPGAILTTDSHLLAILN